MMKRLGALLFVVGLVLLVVVSTTTALMADNNTANSTLTTGTMVMTCSISDAMQRAGPVNLLTNGAYFTTACHVQSALNITFTGNLDQYLANTSVKTMAAGTVTANTINYISIGANNLTTALDRASPVSDAAVNSKSTVTVLNHNAGTIALMPSTVIRDMGANDNSMVVNSGIAGRAYVHRMTLTRIGSIDAMRDATVLGASTINANSTITVTNSTFT